MSKLESWHSASHKLMYQYHGTSEVNLLCGTLLFVFWHCLIGVQIDCCTDVCGKLAGPALIRRLILCWKVNTMVFVKLGSSLKWGNVDVAGAMLQVRAIAVSLVHLFLTRLRCDSSVISEPFGNYCTHFLQANMSQKAVTITTQVSVNRVDSQLKRRAFWTT